jgi:hypothetical protein
MQMNPLRIAQWNINGLVHRKHEVELFLHLHNTHILLISEARFSPMSYIVISGYTV